MALSLYIGPLICIDCSAAKSRLDELLQCHLANVKPPHCDHWDIWSRIWKLITERPPHSISTKKVKAHNDLKNITDPEERKDAWFNNIADKQAKKSVLDFLGPNFKKIAKDFERYQQDARSLRDFHSYWCEVNTVMIEAGARTNPRHSSTMPNFESSFDATHATPIVSCIPEVVASKWPFGEVFLGRICTYLQGLPFDNSQGCTSLLQLYIDFDCHTNSYVPVFMHIGEENSKGPVKSYVLRDLNPLADIQPHVLADHSRMWHRTMKWLEKNWPQWPFGTLHQGNALSEVGYSIPQTCFSGRVLFRTGDNVSKNLWQYFHTDKGTIRSLSRRWIVSHAGG